MKSIVFLALVFLFCFPAPAHAGNIYGSLWLDGKPVQGAQIQITCSSPYPPVQTDNNGAYRIFVPERGRCTFVVRFSGQSAQTEIASYDNAIKYDFDVVRQGAGYTMRRR